MRRRETREGLVWPPRDLTANLLRIAKGSGSPLELMKQLQDCLEALRLYVEAHNALPPMYEIHQILDCDRAWDARHPDSEERRADLKELLGGPGNEEREMALRLIRSGALQIVASRLLKQVPQQSKGEHDVFDGIRMLREANAMSQAHRAKNKKSLEDVLAAMKELDKRERDRKRKPRKP